MSFFDFLNSINLTKEDLIKKNPLDEKDYVPFMVNRGLSYFPDTIMFANEINKHAGIDKRMQYAFLLNGISKKKRFSKWAKKEKAADSVKYVMQEYGYSEAKARLAMEILTEDQISEITAKYFQGGR